MNMRDLIKLCESEASFCDRAIELAAQCGVHAELCDIDPDDSVWSSVAHDLVSPDTAVVINELEAETKQSGHGTKALQGICDLADRMGVELVLYPQSRLPEAVLVRWYMKAGFRRLSNGWMVRSPNR